MSDPLSWRRCLITSQKEVLGLPGLFGFGVVSGSLRRVALLADLASVVSSNWWSLVDAHHKQTEWGRDRGLLTPPHARASAVFVSFGCQPNYFLGGLRDQGPDCSAALLGHGIRLCTNTKWSGRQRSLRRGSGHQTVD